MEVVTDPATKNIICQETWDMVYRQIYGGFTNITQVSHNFRKTFILSSFSQFVFPFATIIISYSSIVVKLRERSLSGKPGSR